MAKRTAAILGETPEFLIWAFEAACPFRFPDRRGACQGAFRQLRSLREAWRGENEGRIVEGWILHPEAASQTPEKLLGFLQHEVLETYGSRTLVSQTCGQCPVNIDRPEHGWAGCFGFLTLHNDEKGLLPLLVQSARLSATSDAEDRCPAWYRYFWEETADIGQLRQLRWVVAQVENASKKHVDARDLREFRQALDLAIQNDARLHIEYFSQGISDGNRWRIPAHCRWCRQPRPRPTTCPRCGRQGGWVDHTTRRVLGIRPYLHVADVIGPEAARKFRRGDT